jgi:hypothetical protein
VSGGGGTAAGSLSREVALEKELNEAQEKVSKLKDEKETLEASVEVGIGIAFMYRALMWFVVCRAVFRIFGFCRCL